MHALCAQLAHTAWSARKGPPGPNFPALMNTKSPWSSPGKQVCHRRRPASTVQVSSRQVDGFTLSSKVAAQRSGSAQLENDKAVWSIVMPKKKNKNLRTSSCLRQKRRGADGPRQALRPLTIDTGHDKRCGSRLAVRAWASAAAVYCLDELAGCIPWQAFRGKACQGGSL